MFCASCCGGGIWKELKWVCSILILWCQLGWLELEDTLSRWLLCSCIWYPGGDSGSLGIVGSLPFSVSFQALCSWSVAELSDSCVVVHRFKNLKQKLTVLLKDTPRTTYSIDLSNYRPVQNQGGR